MERMTISMIGKTEKETMHVIGMISNPLPYKSGTFSPDLCSETLGREKFRDRGRCGEGNVAHGWAATTGSLCPHQYGYGVSALR